MDSHCYTGISVPRVCFLLRKNPRQVYDGRKRSDKKKRAPAWCDRVLWRVRDARDDADSRAAGVTPPVECVAYVARTPQDTL